MLIICVSFLFLVNYLDNFISYFVFLNYNLNQFSIEMLWGDKTKLFSVTLMIIVFNIFLFKNYYMAEEKNKFYFNFLFYWFVLSMFVLLWSQNWLMMIVGWDMLGVSSYLLIVFYNNSSSFNSGFATMNTNRLGDVFFISFLAICFNKNMMGMNEKINFIVAFLMICLLTKSAQFPFSSWLPLAMAAPTPISSLVHSSTLVTAGLFVFYKTDIMFSKKLIIMIFMISLWTSLYSGFMAVSEKDMKKMIALSTLSQLSFMFLAFSLGMIYLSFLQLLTHAIFKASLFFWAGMMIHNSKSEQQFLSFNNKDMKITQSMTFLVFISLLGIPFSMGFYSKDRIVDFLKDNYSFLMNLLMILSIFITLMYTIRLMKKINTVNFNLFFYKMKYTNLINSFSAMALFSLLLMSSKLMQEHWFKNSFLLTSKGWKNFFLTNMLILIFFNWFTPTIHNTLVITKMMYINIYTMKVLSVMIISMNKKNFYFDFGWLNNLSLVLMKKNIMLNKMLNNLKYKFMNMIFVVSFLLMNMIY